MKLSIIIIHYKVKKVLFDCLESIQKSKPKFTFEVIIVDNDERGLIKAEIKKKFSWVRYIKALKNRGFGAGNNIGAQAAQGEFLFFLNPDTLLFPKALDNLVKFLEKRKNVGIVAPILLDKSKIPYRLQGVSELTPLKGIVTLSFLNKFFPKNPISKKYWLSDWDKKRLKEVDVAPGTAFMISKNLFDQIGGFDERFFLYFEEFDLCRRVRSLGYKIFINPSSKIIHLWGESTKSIKGQALDEIFSRSRFLYFRKNFSLFYALIVQSILSVNKVNVSLAGVLVISAFLNFYRLSELMMFIGDQGWFYLSARDILLTGEIPLVGITASHTWLHQGPLWTYILAVLFWLFRFNPTVPAYFVAGLGVVSVWLLYKVSSLLFSKRTGLIAALLYTASPLVIVSDRMPYHTSPIPFFTLLFILCLYKWFWGKINFFPFSILFLAILYNLELATQVLWFVLFVFLVFGVWRKSSWAKGVLEKKILILSFLALFFPLIPILIYDVSHGFPQTIKFGAWTVYRTISFSPANILSMISYLADFIKRLIFISNSFFALIIFFSSFMFLIFSILKKHSLSDDKRSAIIVFLGFCIPVLGFFVNRTASEAYLPLLFPLSIIMVAYFFDFLWEKIKQKFILFIFLNIIVISNILYLSTHNFLIEENFSFTKRLEAARTIIQENQGKEYNLIGKGKGSEFKSFTAGYEYLTWWLGNGPVKKNQNLKFMVEETDRIIIRKVEK